MIKKFEFFIPPVPVPLMPRRRKDKSQSPEEISEYDLSEIIKKIENGELELSGGDDHYVIKSKFNKDTLKFDEYYSISSVRKYPNIESCREWILFTDNGNFIVSEDDMNKLKKLNQL